MQQSHAMKITVLEAIPFDGRTLDVGIHEVSAVEAESIFMRGRARPATAQEVEDAAGAAECASAAPVIEAAAERKARGSRARA